MRKRILKIVAVLLLLFGMAIALSIFARFYILDQVRAKVQAKVSPCGGNAEMEYGRMFWCIEGASLDFGVAGDVRAKWLCLENPISSILGREAFEISVQEIRARMSFDALETIERGCFSNIGESGASQRGISSGELAFRVKVSKAEAELIRGVDRLMLHAEDGVFSLEDGKISGHGRMKHRLDMSRARFAISNMPVAEVSFTHLLGAQKFGIEVLFTPSIEASFAVGKQSFVSRISGLGGDIGSDGATLFLRDVSVLPSPSSVLPPIVEHDRADSVLYRVGGDEGQEKRRVEKGERVERGDEVHRGGKHELLRVSGIEVGVSLEGFRYRGVTSVRMDEPRLRIDLDAIVDSPYVRENAVLSALVQFWKQDAGAFLGEAPRKSVRREDVKKSKPKVEKNPIPREKLQAARQSLAALGQRFLSLPAIEIRNGCVVLQKGDAAYEMDAISVNTQKMVRDSADSKNFEIHFDIRDADVMFGFAFPEDEFVPKVRLKVSRLQASDFLRLLNLPIPERNEGNVSFDVTVWGDEGALRLGLQLETHHFSFYHPKISPNLIEGIDLNSEMTANYVYSEDKLAIEPIRVTLEPLTVRGAIDVKDLRSEPVIAFRFFTDEIGCEALARVIPKGLLPTIKALSFEGGRMSPTVWGTIPWRYPLTASLKESGFEDRCIPTRVEPHHPEEILSRDYVFTTQYTYFSDAIRVGPGESSYVPLRLIPPYVKAAMLLTEDKRFFEHGPLRISFIERALRLNLNARRYVYGGSTIGQQLTKNLFLTRHKNIARKLEEAIITWYMETIVPKSRMFELYVNIIEFGPDIYGIENAARFYFGKHASQLTPLEGAYLASLKVSPSKGGRFYKSGFPKDGRWWNKRMKYILKVLAENGYISPMEVLAAYPWIPEFDYPKDEGDERQKWLENYAAYLKRESKQRRQLSEGVEEEEENAGNGGL